MVPGKPAWWDADATSAMLICRVSDKKQLDGVSLGAQLHRQTEYAQTVGLEVVETEQFQESAKESAHRVRFRRALEKARRGGIRHLIFFSSDRLSRNFTDSEMLESAVRKGEFIVHFATDNRVLHRATGDAEFFMQDINTAQSKQENRIRSSKTISGMEERCRNGWYPSRVPSFYFQQPLLDDDGRMKRRGSTVEGPTEEGRRLVRREAELHLQGCSLGSIRTTCLREGLVPAKMIGSYSRSAIDKHLKNEFYAALEKPHDGFKSQFTWRGTHYEAKHEPIFSYDEWTRLQASFGKRATYRKLKHHALFNRGPLRLTCAAPDCGCQVTYAPKVKGEKTFRYYRCADGKFVHRGQKQPQVNLSEERILEQLGTALDRICIGDELAVAIADELNAAHRVARTQRERAVVSLQAELGGVDEKEDRLFKRLDSGDIDGQTYKRQLERVRAERDEAVAKLKAAQGSVDDAYLVTASRVLELAKSAKKLWLSRSPDERVELLARLVCNLRLEGRNVLFDLKKPFALLTQMRDSGDWRPQGDSNPC
jgi:DNA invertase Pin-like site-specific DNA recombinase